MLAARNPCPGVNPAGFLASCPDAVAWRDLAGTRYSHKIIFQRSVAHNLRVVIHECQYASSGQ